DPLATAVGEIEFALVCLMSSRYRLAYENIERGYRVLTEYGEVRQDFNMARAVWTTRLTAPWALLCAGELGRALEQFDLGIMVFGQNGNHYGRRTLQLVRAWALFHCGDFRGTLLQCQEVAAETADDPTAAAATEVRRRLVLEGLAEVELGDLTSARQHLL